MARPKKVTKAQENFETLDRVLAETNGPQPKLPSIEDMPLTTFREYRQYNEEARKLNKRLRINRYPIKQCPVELHPKQRVVFGRKDQPSNPLPVHLSNHLIHFEQTLIPGKTYDLPECVINHLSSKGSPIWDWIEGKDGAKETAIVGKDPRFTLRTIYDEE